MLSYDLMLNDYSTYWQHFFSLKGTLVYMDLVNFGLINEIMGDIKTESSLVIPVGEYAFDSYEQGTLADSYKRYISNLKYCANRGKINHYFFFFFFFLLYINYII